MCLLLFYSSLLLVVAAVFSIADEAQVHFSPLETVILRYVGIWYKKISVTTIVWVANRDTPIPDLSGVMRFTNPGILVFNHNKCTVWSSNTSRTAQNPVARLLNLGNLVVIDRSDDAPENFLWQSFDYPGDTYLPGYAEKFVREGSVIKFWSGPWKGVRFNGKPQLNPNPIYTYSLVSKPDEMYYSYKLRNSSILSRVVLNSDGLVWHYTWIDRTKGWFLYLTAQIDNCDNYEFCGVYGACNIEKSPVYSCLKGCIPKFPKEWDLVDWSHGCVRKTSLNCTGDVFQKYSGVKFPSIEQSWLNRSMNPKECEMVCMKNCSCTAYTNLDI
ncbi:G-type lectin S-receptor-like serine/threonine-protein kinase At4g27290 [Pyrus x bretschneideri]|uniref:G-type lectin S-receptor-like serine/threonine-protein kinase At4g27290 n=1 Tax=Pyrus x bretschneideri TaxID=225117 RepID=UPI00202ED014|nr:G-type lectin S-receptor-like serine/threonine-protein kinase At4g27290 [Pyrus x bretschneideri]